MHLISGFCCGTFRTPRLLVGAMAAMALAASSLSTVAAPADRLGTFPTLILVRHADTAPQPDRPLSAAGLKRARDLAAALGNAGVTAIITTQLRRTRETAQPLATALGLTPEVIDVGGGALVANPAPGAQLPPEVLQTRAAYVKVLEEAIRRHSGVVLVVGHDWSGPGLIASLGGPEVPNICPSIFDKLFVLTSAQGKVNLVQARYGDPSPDDCK